jgi:hypothetical protein
MNDQPPQQQPAQSLWKTIGPMLASGIILLIAGIAIGIWFSQNYRIVPADQAGRTASVPPPPDLTTAPGRQAVNSCPPGGPFSYRFREGETLRYALRSHAGGTGAQKRTGPLGVDVDIQGLLALETKSVDSAGNGTLELGFREVDMTGEFMGGPVEMRKDASGISFGMDGRSQVDTAAGQSIAGIPQLEFFQQAIRMVVAPNGEVISVSGAGLDQMISPTPLIGALSFPAPELDTGTQWESQFSLPVPGMGTAPVATAINTLDGYDTVNGRHCAVIRQELRSTQENGSLFSPESALGKSMGFAMPEFSLQGNNTLFFDVENGCLVHSDINLEFHMKLAPELKGFVDLLGMYGELLRELEDGSRQPRGQRQQKADETDLGLRINATLSLVDSTE